MAFFFDAQIEASELIPELGIHLHHFEQRQMHLCNHQLLEDGLTIAFFQEELTGHPDILQTSFIQPFQGRH